MKFLLLLLLLINSLLSRSQAFEFDDEPHSPYQASDPSVQSQFPSPRHHHFTLPHFSRLYTTESHLSPFISSHNPPPPSHRFSLPGTVPRPNHHQHLFSHLTNPSQAQHFNRQIYQLFNPPNRQISYSVMRHLIQPSSFFPTESRSNYVNEMFTKGGQVKFTSPETTEEGNEGNYEESTDQQSRRMQFDIGPEEDMETSASEQGPGTIVEPPPSDLVHYGMADFIDNYSQWPTFMDRSLFDGYPITTEDLHGALRRHRVDLRAFGGSRRLHRGHSVRRYHPKVDYQRMGRFLF